MEREPAGTTNASDSVNDGPLLVMTSSVYPPQSMRHFVSKSCSRFGLSSMDAKNSLTILCSWQLWAKPVTMQAR